jgi:hypothetical protein
MSEFSSSNIQTLSERILPSMLYVLRTSNLFTKERDSIFRILSSMGGVFPADISLFPLVQPGVRDVDSISDFESLEPKNDASSGNDEPTQVQQEFHVALLAVLTVCLLF